MDLHVLTKEREVKPSLEPYPLVVVPPPPTPPEEARSTWRADLLWCLGLAALGFVGSLLVASQIDPIVFERHAQDTWFDADVSRVVSDMTSRSSSHFRTSVHPLFSLLFYPATALIKVTFGMSAASAAGIVLALGVAALLAVFFVLLRLMACRRLDALAFTLLLGTSASSIFFSGVPDTFMLGSTTILVALCLAAVAARRYVAERWYVVVSALTLSFTTTNWMAGIATTFAFHRWRRALQVTANAFVIVVVLWGFENILFRGVNFFLVLRSESQWILPEGMQGWPAVAKAFFFHSIVMPEIAVLDTPLTASAWPLLSVQSSPLASGSILAVPAVILWGGLFAAGLYSVVAQRYRGQFRMLLCVLLAGQFGLHLLYGRETFLFSPHFVPLLILVAALGTQTKARRAVVLASIVLIGCCAYNNILQFTRASRYIHSFSQAHRAAPAGPEISPSAPHESDLETTLLAGEPKDSHTPSLGVVSGHE